MEYCIEMLQGTIKSVVSTVIVWAYLADVPQSWVSIHLVNANLCNVKRNPDLETPPNAHQFPSASKE